MGSSSGSIFDTSNFASSPLRARNAFSKLVGSRLAQSADPQECQMCQCVADESGAAKSVCRKCINSISDYIPQMWSSLKHPRRLQAELDQQFKEYMSGVVSL